MEKKTMVENGIRSLLGEEQLFAGTWTQNRSNHLLSEVEYVVEQAAKALSMPTSFLGNMKDKVQDKEPVALLRRFLHTYSRSGFALSDTEGFSSYTSALFLFFP